MLRFEFKRPGHEADALRDALAPHIGDPALGIAGLHLLTFNELMAAWDWWLEDGAASAVA